MANRIDGGLANIYQNPIETRESDPIKEKILGFLKKEGVLEERDGFLVFDKERFLNPEFIERLKWQYVPGSDGKRARFNSELIYEKLNDLEAVSLEDFEKGESSGESLRPKPMFNKPESVNEAFDLEKLKAKDYYLEPWDIHGKTKYLKQDIRAGNGETISLKEFFFAKKLFGEHKAHRDENGELVIIDEKSGKKIKITADWIGKNIGPMGGYNTGGDIAAHPQQFLLDNCTNLINKGLIRLDDFRIVSGFKSAGFVRKEDRVNFNNGYVSHGGIRYYIGKNNFRHEGKSIPTENIKVVTLDSKTAGIVGEAGGSEKLHYVFDLLTEEERKGKKEEVRENSGRELTPSQLSQRAMVGKREMNSRLRPWFNTEENPQRENESSKTYAERLGVLGDYGYLKKITEDFSKQGIGLHNLSWREQQWLASAAYQLQLEGQYDRLQEFAKAEEKGGYGLNGLKSFLSCEFDLENGKKILDIGETAGRENAREIFNSYVKIQASAQALESLIKGSRFLEEAQLPDKVKKSLRENIYAAIMSRSTDMLSTAQRLTKTKEAKTKFYNGKDIKVKSLAEVAEAMEIYESFLEKIKSFFTGAGRYDFKLAGSVDLEELIMHNFLVTDKESGATSYSTVSLRSQGTNAHQKDFEFDGEARINFLFNETPIAADINKKSRKEATTFRLDRECLIFDPSGEKVLNKDNTREDGRLAFDFGSIYEDSGRKNSVMGRVISVGNAITSKERKRKPEFYHNKESFYKELGNADIFRKIVEALDKFIEAKYKRDEEAA